MSPQKQFFTFKETRKEKTKVKTLEIDVKKAKNPVKIRTA